MNNTRFLDFITMLSFGVGLYALIIGLENLEENRKQSDEQQNLLLFLEEHLKNQDTHLQAQDKLLERSGMIEGNT